MSSAADLPVTNVKLGKHDQPIEFDFKKFQHTPLGKLVIYRLRNNYDLKLIITGDVGEGKTALGVDFARWVRRIANGIFDKRRIWDVEQHAGLDVFNYLEAYRSAKPGDALIIDELQEAADSRRANRNENVWLSWAWMKLRVRQVVSIGIMPTTSALDKRLMELADVRLHVEDRGKARAYYLSTEPFEPYRTYHVPFRMGNFRQFVGWPDLAGDDDYERLHAMKMDTGIPGIDNSDHLTEDDLKEAMRTFKKSSVERALDKLENGGITSQTDLAEVLEIDQSTVSKYKRELVEA